MSPASAPHAQAAESPAGEAIFAARLSWPDVLFAARPARRELLGLHAPWPLTPRRIRVHRNHAVELALSIARPYLEYAGIAPEWVLGDYDDSLALDAPAPPAGAIDLELVWLDFSRFAGRMAPAELGAWLAGRLAVLRARSEAPILLLDSDADSGPLALDGVAVAARGALIAELGAEDYFDPARAELTGTRMSAAGSLATGRRLGGRWLPALLAPRARGLVVDLDNTLYAGVLGEDGAAGVELTDGHRALQARLRELHDDGLFLGLVSRNEPEDVRALFTARPDFPLGIDDFDATEIGWGAKSEGVARVAAALRVVPSTLVFLDDNAGELLEVARALPGMSWLRASPDATATLRALEDLPGLHGFARTEADALRTADLRANREREATLAGSAGDLGAYLRELGVTLTVGHDRPADLARVAELSGKTNQFNLALARLSAAEVSAAAADPAVQIATARLEDRLTDSGLIGFAIARRDGDRLLVEDLCISCRALGRRLEDLIVTAMLTGGSRFAGVTDVGFRVSEGPRNAPARDWLAAFAGAPASPGELVVSAERVRAASTSPDVRIATLRDD